MTPHSIRLYEGESDPRTVTPGTVVESVGASDDARSGEAQTAQHPAHPTPLRLVGDTTIAPEALDNVVLAMLFLEVKELRREVKDLRKQVKDINYREAV